MTVYDPHPANGKMLSEEQMTGTFSFLHCAGLTGYRDTACELCYFDIPVDADIYNPDHFCSDCRGLLASYKNYAFLIVDIFDEASPWILPIEESVTYELRCYRVSTVYNVEHNRYELTVQGMLNLPYSSTATRALNIHRKHILSFAVYSISAKVQSSHAAGLAAALPPYLRSGYFPLFGHDPSSHLWF